MLKVQYASVRPRTLALAGALFLVLAAAPISAQRAADVTVGAVVGIALGALIEWAWNRLAGRPDFDS